MTTAIFTSLFAAFATATGLVVEAIKHAFDGSNKTYASNLITIIVGFIVGLGGTCVYYIMDAIPFTVPNIISAVVMGIAVPVGSMVGYDKVTQLGSQLSNRTTE